MRHKPVTRTPSQRLHTPRPEQWVLVLQVTPLLKAAARCAHACAPPCKSGTLQQRGGRLRALVSDSRHASLSHALTSTLVLPCCTEDAARLCHSSFTCKGPLPLQFDRADCTMRTTRRATDQGPALWAKKLGKESVLRNGRVHAHDQTNGRSNAPLCAGDSAVRSRSPAISTNKHKLSFCKGLRRACATVHGTIQLGFISEHETEAGSTPAQRTST